MFSYRMLSIYLLLSFFLLSCDDEENATTDDTSTGITSKVIPNTLEQIRNDMTLRNEGIPRGAGQYDWAEKPRRGWGNNPDTTWNAMTTWGQVYAAEGTAPPENVRFQIKNMQTWYLDTLGEWHRWQLSSNVGGANYAEDFQNDESIEADIRQEDEGASATVVDGYNFHFWPDEGRVTMDPKNIEAVWTAIDARLIMDDPDGPNNLDQRSLMMSVGADYWKSLDAQWDQWTTNGDIAIGRFRYMTENWQTFNMHTMSEEVLTTNPPPFDQ